MQYLVQRFDWLLLLRKRRWNDCRRQFGAFLPVIKEYDLGNVLFQQELDTNIVRFDTIRLFLCGYAEERIYADKTLTLKHLKTNIRQYVLKSTRKLSRKNQCWQNFTFGVI